jgi:hypothetical protein
MGMGFMENLKYLVSTLLILWCLMLFFSFSSLIAISVFRYALSQLFLPVIYSILALSVLPALLPLLLHVYLKKRCGETRALPPLVAMILFFAANYFYAFYWGLLSFETAVTLIQFSLIITLFTSIVLFSIYYIYRQRHRRAEDYIAEVIKKD